MSKTPRTLVLRKSVGPYSAGTPMNKVDYGGVIDLSLVEMLRSRTDIVPAENRSTRRAKSGKKLVYDMLHANFNTNA